MLNALEKLAAANASILRAEALLASKPDGPEKEAALRATADFRDAVRYRRVVAALGENWPASDEVGTFTGESSNQPSAKLI